AKEADGIPGDDECLCTVGAGEYDTDAVVGVGGEVDLIVRHVQDTPTGPDEDAVPPVGRALHQAGGGSISSGVEDPILKHAQVRLSPEVEQSSGVADAGARDELVLLKQHVGFGGRGVDDGVTDLVLAGGKLHDVPLDDRFADFAVPGDLQGGGIGASSEEAR